MVDLEGRITFANSYMCELLGTTPEEILGASCFEFVFPEDLEQAKTLLEANKMPQHEPFRFKVRRKHGSAFWAEMQGAPLRIPHGPVYGIVATVMLSEQE